MPLGEVESSLADLWRLTGEEAIARGQPGVVRVRELNLIIVATSQPFAGRVSEVVAQLAQHHPGRVVVLLDEPDRAPQETTEAWVSAACYLNREGGRNVCWEQVTIPGRGDAAEHVVTMAIPYLVPDISVAAWWPGDAEVDGQVFADLAEVADKIILDSGGFADPARGLTALASVGSDQRFALADATWNRLTPWREMVAAFFDDPRRRAVLPRLDRATLVYGEEDAYVRQEDPVRRPALARALLLVGWLGTRLGWQTGEDRWRAEEGAVRLSLRRADGLPVEVVLVHREYPQCGFGGLHQVSLEAKPGQADGGVPVRRPGGGHLRLLCERTRGDDLHGLEDDAVGPGTGRRPAVPGDRLPGSGRGLPGGPRIRRRPCCAAGRGAAGGAAPGGWRVARGGGAVGWVRPARRKSTS